jgi:hypothetical protein
MPVQIRCQAFSSTFLLRAPICGPLHNVGAVSLAPAQLGVGCFNAGAKALVFAAEMPSNARSERNAGRIFRASAARSALRSTAGNRLLAPSC